MYYLVFKEIDACFSLDKSKISRLARSRGIIVDLLYYSWVSSFFLTSQREGIC